MENDIKFKEEDIILLLDAVLMESEEVKFHQTNGLIVAIRPIVAEMMKRVIMPKYEENLEQLAEDQRMAVDNLNSVLREF